MDKYIGRLLDNRYEILEVIGIGGMAVVYKAKCHRLNRMVAIKILKDDFLEDEDFRSRFHAEGQAVAMLSHPNIVSVYDVSTTAGCDYIVMELIEGITLKQYMQKKGVLNWKETLHFATQIAKALDHAHSRGIVHRDIKPHNIMVLKNGSIKVADFGIARVIAKGNTLTKEALGSVHYISPEQAKGEHVDARSDIYSLGIVMYEMITGKQPYEGNSPVNVALQHITGGAIMPSILNPGIPAGIEQIIMKAMAHSPDNRFDSAVELMSAMDAFRNDPTILFDYHTKDIDPRGIPNLERPGSRRPEKAQEKSPDLKESPKKPVVLPEAKERKRDPAVDKKSKIAKIAVISCSVAILLAIVILSVLLFNGNPFGGGDDFVTVPSLLGKKFSTLPSYPGITIELGSEVYDSFYEAGYIVNQDVQSGTSVQKGTVIYVTVSKGPEPVFYYMPDVIGKDKDDALDILNNLSLGLDVKFEEEVVTSGATGVVLRTNPEKNAEIQPGQTVIVYISKREVVQKDKVPKVLGKDLQEAIKTLDYNGFKKVKFEYVESNQPKDTVVMQTPESGEKVEVTETIYLFVSSGPPETEPTDPNTGVPNESQTTEPGTGA